MLKRDIRINKSIFYHAQIHFNEIRWYPEFGGHTFSLPLIQSLNVKKFDGKFKVGIIYNIVAMLIRDL